MRNISASAPEFSRIFPSDKLRDRPAHERIEADAGECRALAARLGLVDLKSFRAGLDLQRVQSGEVVEVAGRLAATVVQTCVVTLEPFETAVAEEFKAYFTRKAATPRGDDLPVEDEAAPEPMGEDGGIDLGEVATQHLSLALDPHPRKPGAVFHPPVAEEEDVAEKANPFAVLAEFRAKKQEKK